MGYNQLAEEQLEIDKAEQSRLKGCWATPEDFKRVIIPRFKLNFDAAAEENNTLFPRNGRRHVFHLTEENDALKRTWSPPGYFGNRVWLNPPHKQFLPWFEKCWEQITHPQARVDIIVVMALPSFSSKWWRRYAEKADEIIDLSPRVQFSPPKGLKTNNSGNSRDRCLIVFRREPRHPIAPARYTWHWKEEKEW